MSKKKPAKAKKADPAPDELRKACEEIVENLYVEVEKVNGIRLDVLSRRLDDVYASHDVVLRRLEAVEHRGPLRRLIRRLFCRR